MSLNLQVARVVLGMAFTNAEGTGTDNVTGTQMRGTVTICQVCKVQTFKAEGLIQSGDTPIHQPWCPVPDLVEALDKELKEMS